MRDQNQSAVVNENVPLAVVCAKRDICKATVALVPFPYSLFFYHKMCVWKHRGLVPPNFSCYISLISPSEPSTF